jgi:Na+-driven multidrug efflux pump
MIISDKLTTRTIFLFWGPLALTWLMMALEQPFLISVIARLANEKFNLAAFGIAMSFALIVEAPVIMLMSASTALVRNADSYRKLKRFTDILNGSIIVVQLVLLIPPVFNLIVTDLMGVPDEVVRLTYFALLLLLPWPASIGYRRFYQGILIRNNLTRRVTYGTLVRLSVIIITGSLLYKSGLQGAYVGAITLSLAVFFEAVASWLMARKTIIAILNIDKQDEADGIGQPVIPRLDYSFITRFYTPLALTSILSLGVHPFVTFFMGRSAMPIESLAVLPVVNSLVFIFRSMGLSYQEVNIALVGERKQNYKSLRSFALILGIAVTLLLGIVAFTPLSRIWFIKISGLTTELAPLAYLPLKILILLPALSVLLSFQRSTLVVSRQTKPISIATAVELGGIIIVLAVCIGYFNMVGVVAAALAYILGKAASTIYLSPIQISSVKSWNLK